MDFNASAHTIDGGTSQVESNPIANNETLDNQIDSLINSNNFETSINIAFNHLTRMINLNNPDCLLNLNAANESSEQDLETKMDLGNEVRFN